MNSPLKSYNRLWFVFILGFLVVILSLNNCLSEVLAIPVNLPKGLFRNGTTLVWDYDDYLYALVGGRYEDDDRKDFYRYSISQNVWDSLPKTTFPQGAGDAMTWSGYNNKLYAIIGNVNYGSGFAYYDPKDTSWNELNLFADKTDDGCALVWAGDSFLYAFQGEIDEKKPNNNFWSYNINNDRWTELDSLPDKGGVGDGASLLWIGYHLQEQKNYIYALGGGSYTEEPGDGFYRYSIEDSVWEILKNPPFYTGDCNGNRLGFIENHIFYWKGSRKSKFGDGSSYTLHDIFDGEWSAEDTLKVDGKPFDGGLGEAVVGTGEYIYIIRCKRADSKVKFIRISKVDSLK